MRRVYSLAVAIGLFTATSASAQAGDPSVSADPIEDILACQAVVDPTERVGCFDQAAAVLDTARQTGSVIAVNAETIEAVQKDAFGFSMPSLPRLGLAAMLGRTQTNSSDPLSSSDAASEDDGTGQVLARSDDGRVNGIILHIVRTETRANGKLRFYMENGQVWDQLDALRVRIPRREPRVAAYIRRGAIGGFMMRVNNQGRAVRVRRSE